MMRFTYFSVVLALLLFCSVSFAFSGTGTAADPYVLSSCQDLQETRSYCLDQNVFFEMNANIDCADFGNFTPICQDADANEFKGHFNGKDYMISNVTINASAAGRGSLFSTAGHGATLRNVALVDFNVWNSANSASALLGTCNGCDINNVYVYGATIGMGGSQYAAGILSVLTTSGDGEWDSNISNCYVDNTFIYADNGINVGGVVGSANGTATRVVALQNTRSSAYVQSKFMSASGSGGGVLGTFVDNVDGNTTNYWDYQVSSTFHSAFGQALTTANSYKQASYDANWDFTNVWQANEDVNYPTLRFGSKLSIKSPKDEKTNTALSLTKYAYSVSILDGNTFNEYDDLTVDVNSYNVSIGTDYFVVFTIDTNTSADYYPRTYYKKYAASETHVILQPYLVPVADSAEITFYTKDAADNTIVPNIRIEAYRVIESLGRTNVETIRTDESGAGTMSMLVDEEYELVFYDEDDAELFTKTIRANFTSYYVYIDVSSITWEEPTLEWIDISGFPTGPLLYDADGYDINISLDVNGGTASKRWLTIMQDDTNLLFNTSCTADCNFHLTKAQLDAAMEIRVVAFVETASGLVQKVSRNFIPVDSSGYNLIDTLKSDGFRTEWGCSTDANQPCFILLMLSVMLTIAAVASAGIGITTDRSALSLLAAITMGLFVYLTWIPLAFYIMLCLAVFGTMVISRRIF